MYLRKPIDDIRSMNFLMVEGLCYCKLTNHCLMDISTLTLLGALVIFKVGNEYFEGVINIENNRKGKRLKDITKIENITKDMTSQYGKNQKYAFLRDASMISIPDSEPKSNSFSENSSKKSSSDTQTRRYSMDEEPKLPRTAGTMSVGQYKQRVADLTKTKSYMKNQVYDIVKKLPMAEMASEKTRMQMTEAVWQIFCDRWTAHFISF